MNICVFGSGSFGTAIANQLSYNLTNNVFLFCRNTEREEEINNYNTNYKYFPNKKLNKTLVGVSRSTDLSEVEIDLLFLALPSGVILNAVDQLKEVMNDQTLIVNLSKGIFRNGKTIVEFLQENLDHSNVITMKGGAFSAEIINNEHSLFTLGFQTDFQYDLISRVIDNTNIHIDCTTDIRGVELLSALKNVYAIIVGIIDAKYNAVNTRYMILTKAFSEIRILLKELGGNEDTLFLSCGYGDFGLTALNDLSRNRTLGLLIGKGFYTSTIKNSSVVLEGIKTMDLISEKLVSHKREQVPLFNKLSHFFKNEDSNFDINFKELIDKKMRTILTYGTFDLLHYGHVEILRRAKELGDRLIVGLSTDEFNKVKGKVCEISYRKRKELIEVLDYVDLVIPESDWGQKVNDVQKYNIDVFVMGDDWEGKFDFLKEYCDVHYLNRTPGISTTKLKTILNNKD